MVSGGQIGVPGRLARLDRVELDWLPGVRVFVARSRLARLLGLAGLGELPGDVALLIPRCRSVHTFGMRFVLEVAFLDEDWDALDDAGSRVVRPGRVVGERRASAVLERRAR